MSAPSWDYEAIPSLQTQTDSEWLIIRLANVLKKMQRKKGKCPSKHSYTCYVYELKIRDKKTLCSKQTNWPLEVIRWHAAACTQQWVGYKPWRKGPKPIQRVHPTMGMCTHCCRLEACSWPHGTGKLPASAITCHKFAIHGHAKYETIQHATDHADKGRDVGPAPLHVGKGLIADHSGHVIHETICAWQEVTKTLWKSTGVDYSSRHAVTHECTARILP